MPGEDSEFLPGLGRGKVESCQGQKVGPRGLPGWEAKGSSLGLAGRTSLGLEEGWEICWTWSSSCEKAQGVSFDLWTWWEG